MVKTLKGFMTGLSALPPFMRRVLEMILSLLTAAFFSILLITILLHDREVTIPEWGETYVSNQIESSLSGLNLDFDSAFLTLDETWRPSLGFKDIEITQSKNASPILLNRMLVKLSLARALQGALRVNTIQAAINHPMVSCFVASFPKYILGPPDIVLIRFLGHLSYYKLNTG